MAFHRSSLIALNTPFHIFDQSNCFVKKITGLLSIHWQLIESSSLRYSYSSPFFLLHVDGYSLRVSRCDFFDRSHQFHFPHLWNACKVHAMKANCRLEINVLSGFPQVLQQIAQHFHSTVNHAHCVFQRIKFFIMHIQL